MWSFPSIAGDVLVDVLLAALSGDVLVDVSLGAGINVSVGLLLDLGNTSFDICNKRFCFLHCIRLNK